jgi:hypothetical protein
MTTGHTTHPKITHKDLISFAELLGHQNLSQGMCHGFSCMWTQAILTGNTKNFFALLDLIASYKNNFESLITDIEAVKAKRIKAKKGLSPLPELSEKEWALLEIPAFFDGISLYHKPITHSDVFEKHLQQNNIDIVHTLISQGLIPRRLRRKIYG